MDKKFSRNFKLKKYKEVIFIILFVLFTKMCLLMTFFSIKRVNFVLKIIQLSTSSREDKKRENNKAKNGGTM